jgi:uncharacterized protein (UPF0332 family)
VKGQSGAFLEKSQELLNEADAILGINRYEAAARAVYMAGLHAAQALIFETTGRIYKTHSGGNGEFSRLVRDDPRVDDPIRAFLGRPYNLKAIADYQTGPVRTSRRSAREAIDTARRFAANVVNLIPANGDTPSAPEAPKH